MDLFKTEKIIWENQIREVGNLYEKIIGDKLPKYKICFIENVDNITYSMQVLPYENPMILNVNMGFMLCETFNYKATAMHEFTHMYDHSHFLQSETIEYRKKVLSLFSEFHATCVETTFCITDKNLNKNQINELIQYRIEYLIESFKKHSISKDVNSFYQIIKGYMYYYGTLFAANNNMTTKLDEITFDFSCQNFMSTFYKYAKTGNYSKDFFDLVYKIKNLIDKTFIIQTLNNPANT